MSAHVPKDVPRLQSRYDQIGETMLIYSSNEVQSRRQTPEHALARSGTNSDTQIPCQEAEDYAQFVFHGRRTRKLVARGNRRKWNHAGLCRVKIGLLACCPMIGSPSKPPVVAQLTELRLSSHTRRRTGRRACLIGTWSHGEGGGRGGKNRKPEGVLPVSWCNRSVGTGGRLALQQPAPAPPL